MPQVDRFSVSLDTELLAAFDHHIAARGYRNRSEAVRDLIRDLLLQSRMLRDDETICAFLTCTCDHRMRDVGKRVRRCLAENADVVRGSMHVPGDYDHEGLVIALRGPAAQVQAAADALQAMRGVLHGHLAIVPSADKT